MQAISTLIIKAATWLGCTALVTTTALIVLSVLGRHTQIPLPGSVEMVEVLIVVIGSTSLLVATYDNTHASAKLFINRMSPTVRIVVEKIGISMAAIFTASLLVGTVWIIADYWATHEVTPLLGIPVIPFRLLFALSLVLITLLSLIRLISKSKNTITTDSEIE